MRFFPQIFVLICLCFGCTKDAPQNAQISAIFVAEPLAIETGETETTTRVNVAPRSATTFDTVLVSYEPQSGTLNYDIDGFVKRQIFHRDNFIRVVSNAKAAAQTATVERGLRIWTKASHRIAEILDVEDTVQWSYTMGANNRSAQIHIDKDSYLSNWQGDEFRLLVKVYEP